MHLCSWILAIVLAGVSVAKAAAPSFTSGPAPVALLELYTSEGCSSCPPAEQWLSERRDDPGLWKRFVPVSFHVTYWDYLGWRDALAQPAFTARQRAYAADWRSGTVYTPCFVRSGAEWHIGDSEKKSEAAAGGQLTISALASGEWELTYLPPPAIRGELDGYVALLGRGIVSRVRAGENQGRTLTHDFVVLDLAKGTLRTDASKKTTSAVFRLKAGAATKDSLAIAAWVTRHDENAPLQATGGDLR